MVVTKNDDISHLEKALTLLILTSLRGLTQKEQIGLLDRAGYGQNEIARLLDTTANNVSVRFGGDSARAEGAEGRQVTSSPHERYT